MLQASHSHSLGPASDTTKTAKRTCKKPPNEVNSHRLDALAWVHGLVLSAPRHLAGQPQAGGEQQGATIDDASSGHLCEDQISEYGGYNRREDDVDQGIANGMDRLQEDGEAEVGETCGDEDPARGAEHERQFHAKRRMSDRRRN